MKLNSQPVAFSTDIQGNFYLGFQDGRLMKFDPNGIRLENFALSNKSEITLVDVQNNLKPFLFYFDNQQITILDRFSSVPKNYHIGDFGLGLVSIACPAPDGDFWILGNNPQRLLKVNTLRKSIVLEVQVSLGDTVKQMQTYQNLLLIGDEDGLKIFDQFGAIIHTINIEALTNFQVINEEIYVYSSEWIYIINPFKGNIISKLSMPDIQSSAMLKIKNDFITIQSKKVIFFQK
ncbi:MAG: hypothetical protein ABJO91_01395 [Ekhidna sp.]